MTAKLQFESLYGNGEILSLPEGKNATLQLFLTDLPTPISYELYLNKNLVQTSAWNSGIAYEENIPLKDISTTTYNFQAVIHFQDGQTVSTNVGTIKGVATSAFPQAVAQNNSSSNSAVAKETVTPAPSLSMPQKIGIGVGTAGALAVAVGLAIHFHSKGVL